MRQDGPSQRSNNPTSERPTPNKQPLHSTEDPSTPLSSPAEQFTNAGLRANFREFVARALLAAVLPGVATAAQDESSLPGATALSSPMEPSAASEPLQSSTRSGLFDELNDNDLRIIIDEFDKQRLKGPIEGILEQYYADTHPHTSSAQVTEWQRSQSPRQLLRILEQIALDETSAVSYAAAAELDNLEEMLSSPIFKEALAALRSHHPDLKAPYGELASVWRTERGVFDVFVQTASSPAFKEYKNALDKSFQLDGTQSLRIYISEFHRARQGEHPSVSLSIAPAVASFRDAFPDVPIRTAADLFALVNTAPFGDKEASSTAFTTKLNEMAAFHAVLEKGYGLKAKSVDDVRAISLNQDKAALLTSPEAQSLFKYLKDKHSDSNFGERDLSVFLGSVSGFTEGFAEPLIENLRTTGSTMESFLSIFEQSLVTTDLDALDSVPALAALPPIDALARDEKLRLFVSTLFKTYPDFAFRNSHYEIPDLILAYENQSNFNTLNDRLRHRTLYSVPDIQPVQHEQKLAILDVLDELNFDKIKIGGNPPQWGSHLDEPDFLEKLKSPRAATLYTALVKNWGIQSIEFDLFVTELMRDDGVNFWASQSNATKFQALDEMYRFSQGASDNEQRSWHAVLNSCAPDLVQQSTLLSTEGLPALLKRYQPKIFTDSVPSQATGDVATVVRTDPSGLAKICKEHSTLLLNVEETQAKANTLEGLYGVPREAIWETLAGITEIAHEDLTSKAFLESYRKIGPPLLADIGLPGTPLSETRYLPYVTKFELALLLKNEPSCVEILRQLAEIRVPLKNQGAMLYSLMAALHTEEYRTLLNDPTFRAMTRALDEQFYGTGGDFARLSEYGELFRELSNDPTALRTLLDPSFKNLAHTLSATFQVSTFDPSSLKPMMQVAQGFDEQKFTTLVKRLREGGEVLSSNDIIILSEITKTPLLHTLLWDRDTLLEEAGTIYERPAAPRRVLDQLNTLPLFNDPDHPFESAERAREREEVATKYTERPELDSLSRLQLLRVVLVKRMLEQPENQRALAQLVVSDLRNSKTELGGTIGMQGDSLSFRPIESTAQNDNSFAHNKYERFMHGITGFHLHALALNVPDLSGPSGWLGSGGGDFAYVEATGMVDVVFTPLGHPLGPTGQPDLTRLQVNADMYWVDRRDPAAPMARVVDLGLTTVELPLDK